MAETKIKVAVASQLNRKYARLWQDIVRFLEADERIKVHLRGWSFSAYTKNEEELKQIVIDLDNFVKFYTHGKIRTDFRKKDNQVIIRRARE